MVLEGGLFQRPGTSGMQMKTLAELKGLQMVLRGQDSLSGPQNICYFQGWSTHSIPEYLEGKKGD